MSSLKAHPELECVALNFSSTTDPGEGEKSSFLPSLAILLPFRQRLMPFLAVLLQSSS